MATCNGSAYVGAQLQSILSQTRLPDEIVVCDDASSDGTGEAVRSALVASDVPAQVVVNPSRLGVSGNFEQAVHRASGDVVVLADQDDVWHPSKLSTIEAAFRARPGLAAVFSDARLVDAGGRPLGGTLWQRAGLGRQDLACFRAERGVDVLLRHNVATGATMAFDAGLRDLVLPFPASGYHDAWIALLACATSPVLAIEQPLVDYRLHGSNTAGLPARGLLGRIAARRRRDRVHEHAALFFQAALDRLGVRGVAVTAPVRAALEAKVAHLHFRDGLSRNPALRLVPVATHVLRGDYGRFSREGPRSAVYDVIYG
jgi:glycosyltransferase involved in cell wall biosynthesis